MSYVAAVTAIQFGNPVAVFILMKTDDSPFHLGLCTGGRGFCDGRHYAARLEIRDGPHSQRPFLENEFACLDQTIHMEPALKRAVAQ